MTKMKLTKIEKKLVNSTKRGKGIIKTAEQLFGAADLSHVRTVLEVGCGVGALASHLAKRHRWHVTGVDLDPEQIGSARSKCMENEHLSFLKADATELPFERDEFDMVLFFDVLHHIPRWDRAMDEMDRVLKPKGFCVINDLALPVPGIFSGLLEKYGGFYAVGDIVHHLKSEGFDIVYAGKPKSAMVKHFGIVAQKT